MFSLNSANLVTKKIIFLKNYLNLPDTVLETKMLSQHGQETGSREDLSIQPNLCFSSLPDSLNSLNSLNF